MPLIRSLAALSFAAASISTSLAAVDSAQVATTYAEIVDASYQDSLAGALALDAAIEAFTAAPSEETMNAAKQAWLNARNLWANGSLSFLRRANR